MSLTPRGLLWHEGKLQSQVLAVLSVRCPVGIQVAKAGRQVDPEPRRSGAAVAGMKVNESARGKWSHRAQLRHLLNQRNFLSFVTVGHR